MDLARGLDTLLVAAVVAALAPVVVALLPGPRIPQVVVLLAGGVVAGPEVLGWAERAEIDLLTNVGLMLGGRFGRYLLAAGAVGEMFPVLAIALFLGASSEFVALVSLLAVAVLALVLSFAPRLIRGSRLERILREGEGATAQTTVRLTVVLLLLLLVVAETFGLDVVLGAFLAGIVLRRWAPGGNHALEEKLDAIGYGFFIPLFFVASGMTLDVRSIAEAPLRLVAFFLLLLVIRGVPALFLYRRDLPAVQRAR